MFALLLLFNLTLGTLQATPPSDKVATVTVEFTITGMTCQVCQEHIAWKVSQLPGIYDVAVSYRKGNAIVKFDHTKTSIDNIIAAIHSIDFKVVKHRVL